MLCQALCQALRQPFQAICTVWLWCRERADGLFRPITYLVAKLVEELIVAFVVSTGFSAMVFYPVGLTGSYPLFFLTKFVTTSIGIGGHLAPVLWRHSAWPPCAC